MENLNVYQMKKKRIPPVFKLTLRKEESIDEICNHPYIRRVIIDELVYGIKEDLKRKGRNLNLFQIADSDLILEVPRAHWKNALDNAIEYYKENEDYERCAEIRDMIKEL